MAKSWSLLLLAVACLGGHQDAAAEVKLEGIQVGIEAERLGALGVLAEPCKPTQRMHEDRCKLSLESIYGVPVLRARALTYAFLVEAVIAEVDGANVLAMRDELTQRFGQPDATGKQELKWSGGVAEIRLTQASDRSSGRVTLKRRTEVVWRN